MSATALAPASRRSRKREGEALRIEKAALLLFLDRGLDTVTVEDIADAADISRRTYFRYFPSRDGVLAAVHRRAMRRVQAAVRAQPYAKPLIDAISDANGEIYASAHNPVEAELSELSRRLMLRHPEAWERIIVEVGRAMEEELTEAIAFRLRAGHEDVRVAGPLAAVTWSVGCCVFREWLRDGARTDLSHSLYQAFDDVRRVLSSG